MVHKLTALCYTYIFSALVNSEHPYNFKYTILLTKINSPIDVIDRVSAYCRTIHRCNVHSHFPVIKWTRLKLPFGPNLMKSKLDILENRSIFVILRKDSLQ